jgi:DMSO/TMAO reductase YedYZ molybdopterin-dependent catalytic subunit
MSAPTPTDAEEPAWLHPHVHEPNPTPPSPDPTLILARPDGTLANLTPNDLASLPQHSAPNCYIVSTGHGTSGPFDFKGVILADVLAANGVATWRYADVISADGFGTRLYAHEFGAAHELSEEDNAPDARPILLALERDGQPLTREQGLVRLIVPQERDDALRQVKWVARIEVHE